MTVVIPQWLFDHMVAKFGLEEATKTIQALRIKVGDWPETTSSDEEDQNSQGGRNGLG